MWSFDSWAYESSLHEGDPSPVEHTLALLEQQGHTYTSEGALWLRTTDFGDDKDRVLVRSSGEHTYFASDIAYHQDKRERGFERQIDVWGADHHGYVLRMKAAYEALGGDPDELELLIMQLVHLMSSGERAQMSKRAGEFVTLDELVAEIGVDAARWYLLARSHDTTVDLDLDLAREQSSENPVYYVQYAHARIASMLEKAGAERVQAACAARRGAGARAAARGRARAGGAAAGVPRGSSPRRPSAAPRTGSRRTRWRWRRRSPRSTATATWSAPSRATVESFRIALCVASRAHDRALPGSARGERAGEDVGALALASCATSCLPASSRLASSRAGVSVEAREVGLEPRAVGGAERHGGAGGGRPRACAPAPAGQQREHGCEQREHDGERHEVDGEVEAVCARQPEHGGAVLRRRASA